jgi:triosephosphate isomerase
MRRKLVAANWKMNKTIGEAEAFAAELAGSLDAARGCDLLVIPPYLSLPAVVRALDGTGVAVGAQDLSWEHSGAFTGEVSGAMIADVGASFVLAGHSERRHVIGEDDAIVARKLRAALDAGLTPILCVGEQIDEREAGRHEDVVAGQLSAALDGWSEDDVGKIVVAYEPVWAIGTGKTATPEDAETMHAFIRGHVVKPENAGSLLGRDEIDGALVGGASLQVASFIGIAAAV